MTYGYCKKIIASGKYDKNEMKDKLDVFLLLPMSNTRN